MFYRVEAIRSLSGSQGYDSDGEIVMTTRSRRHGDVCRAIYHYLLAGYWVRILNDDNRLIGGPFRPGAALPASFKAFTRSLDWSENGKTMSFQDPQADIHESDVEERPSLLSV